MSSLLRRILYISRIGEDVTDASLRLIVASAQMNNRRNDISGVLALAPGLFAQVLEGAPDVIAQTLQRIRQDARHSDLRVVDDTATDSRMFDRWSMELLVDDTSADLTVAVRDGHREGHELVEHLRDQHARDPLWWTPTLNTMALAT